MVIVLKKSLANENPAPRGVHAMSREPQTNPTHFPLHHDTPYERHFNHLFIYRLTCMCVFSPMILQEEYGAM